MSDNQRQSAPAHTSAQVRLEDVAAAAGVSRTSASRVMLGQNKVSAETRRKVFAAADELGYVPNVAASELASGGSSTIGLLLRNASNPAYGLLFTELQEAAHSLGISLVSMTINFDDTGRKQVSSLHRLMGMRVAGLIVATGGVSSEQLEPFRSQVPILRVARHDSSGRIHSVSYDHDDAGRRLAEHVLGLGHSEVVVQVTSEQESLPEFLRATSMVRTLQSHGATVHELVPSEHEDVHGRSIELVKQGRATAIMTPQDIIQLDLLRRLRAEGLRSPGDVTTTGCDGVLPGIDLLGLTTVRIPVEEVANRAMNHIARLTGLVQPSGKYDTTTIVNERVQGPLIVGTTAGPAPQTSTHTRSS